MTLKGEAGQTFVWRTVLLLLLSIVGFIGQQSLRTLNEVQASVNDIKQDVAVLKSEMKNHSDHRVEMRVKVEQLEMRLNNLNTYFNNKLLSQIGDYK
jgi:hypothetical protein